jgi:CheY-like chemotaxis protein
MVLLVDDDQDVREAVGDFLGVVGYEVALAENGSAALARLAAEGVPCIVLLDLVMPVMDGWQFLDVVHADARLAAMPVVIASAHAETHPPRDVAAILPKPFDLDTLLRLVEEHCGPPPGASPAAAR